MMGEACSEGEKAPAKASHGQPDAWRNLLQNEVVGDLTEEVAAVEDSVYLVELSALASQRRTYGTRCLMDS
jgi:hypothetical protein